MAVLTLPNHAVCNDLAKKVESYSNQNCAREIHTGITSEAMQEKKKKEKKRKREIIWIGLYPEKKELSQSE